MKRAKSAKMDLGGESGPGPGGNTAINKDLGDDVIEEVSMESVSLTEISYQQNEEARIAMKIEAVRQESRQTIMTYEERSASETQGKSSKDQEPTVNKKAGGTGTRKGRGRNRRVRAAATGGSQES